MKLIFLRWCDVQIKIFLVELESVVYILFLHRMNT